MRGCGCFIAVAAGPPTSPATKTQKITACWLELGRLRKGEKRINKGTYCRRTISGTAESKKIGGVSTDARVETHRRPGRDIFGACCREDGPRKGGAGMTLHAPVFRRGKKKLVAARAWQSRGVFGQILEGGWKEVFGTGPMVKKFPAGARLYQPPGRPWFRWAE